MTTCSCSTVGNCTCAPGTCTCAKCHGGKDKNDQAATCSCTTKDAQGADSCKCSSEGGCKCGDKCTCTTCGKKGAAAA